MTLLVIGKRGQVARALAARASLRDTPVVIVGRPELDLSDFAGTLPRANAVLNAAAYTQVDDAENHREMAYLVNERAAGALAAKAVDAQVFVHFSTDYVFSGDKASPYVEEDPVAPINAYGASKLAGERAVTAANPRSVILRTSWVYDAMGANFVRTMLRLAKTRNEIRVVGDQHGSPTFASDLAEAALTITGRPSPFGVYHCSGSGYTTWAGFAEEIFAQSRVRGGPSAVVLPITGKEFQTRARRPSNSRLDCSRLESDYGVRMRPWREALVDCMDEIARGGWSVG